MTPDPTPAELLEEQVSRLVADARRRGVGDDQCERLRMALRVPCPPPGDNGRGKGCGAPAGVACQNMAGGDLGRQAFHWFRGQAAGVTWEPTAPWELAETPQERAERERRAWERRRPDPVAETAAGEQGWRR